MITRAAKPIVVPIESTPKTVVAILIRIMPGFCDVHRSPTGRPAGPAGLGQPLATAEHSPHSNKGLLPAICGRFRFQRLTAEGTWTLRSVGPDEFTENAAWGSESAPDGRRLPGTGVRRQTADMDLTARVWAGCSWWPTRGMSGLWRPATSPPWLAENFDVVADKLGLVLTVVATEVPVGSFYLDIQAETEDGRTVIVENQLARTASPTTNSCARRPDWSAARCTRSLNTPRFLIASRRPNRGA